MKWKKTTLFECFRKPGPEAIAALDDTADETTETTEKEPDATVTTRKWKVPTS